MNEKDGVINFADRLIDEIIKRKSYLCVGLDPQLRYIPPHILKYCAKRYGPGFKATAEAIIMFNRAIIDATNEFALCFKPQMAFYEKYRSAGVAAFYATVEYIKSIGMMVIEDAKREDGGDTAEAYADGHLGEVEIIGEDGELVMVKSFDVDAITITPWIDEPNFLPFIKAAEKFGKGIFVVDKTSFKPASRF
jgi:orotidine-5'-phosphate decarboxylase